MHEAATPTERDPPETRRQLAANDENGHASRTAGGDDSPTALLLCDDLNARRDDPSCHIAPDCNQQLARHGDDGDATGASP